ncbi:MAG: type II glyceraldehyde-3-phosphate dehydrogenase [Thermoplasmata archaeon]
MKVKVAINGYGTIGKRVADAVKAQDDMEVVGVTKTRPTFEAREAIEAGFPLYISKPENIQLFKDAGIPISGTLDELLDKAQIVVDCAPGKMGADNKALYEKKKIKAIFQGGEKHKTAGTSFNAMANYKEAIGKQFVRVVSCNTTGLCRTLYPLDVNFGIEEVNAAMIRRAVDPNDSTNGPVNAIEPVLKVPSHHGPDVQTIMPHLNISTMAVAVPTTLMHVHCVTVNLKKEATAEQIINVWKKTPRVKMFKGSDGFESTAQIMESARDAKRPRSDLNEIAVWEDGTHVVGKKLYYYQAIHQESDVVPENIDCIRAMMGLEKDNMKSIMKTNKALNIH